MDTFLVRYQHGEHTQVWRDMLALGAAIHQPEVMADSLAVARETMRRIRCNIETLIPRLQRIGYTFGYASIISHVPSDDLHYIESESQPFMLPVSSTIDNLTKMINNGMIMPFSIQAWYEQVGAVNFVGSMPSVWHDSKAQEAWEDYEIKNPPSETFPQWDTPIPEYTEKSGYTVCIDEPVRPKPPKQPLSDIDLDPLYILDLDSSLQRMHEMSDGSKRFVLSPDKYFKYYMGGGGSYTIDLPNLQADADFWWEPGQHMTFVEYLRLCFQWGGLPGLGIWDQGTIPPSVPKADIEFLREGLLPF